MENPGQYGIHELEEEGTVGLMMEDMPDKLPVEWAFMEEDKEED